MADPWQPHLVSSAPSLGAAAPPHGGSAGGAAAGTPAPAARQGLAPGGPGSPVVMAERSRGGAYYQVRDGEAAAGQTCRSCLRRALAVQPSSSPCTRAHAPAAATRARALRPLETLCVRTLKQPSLQRTWRAAPRHTSRWRPPDCGVTRPAHRCPPPNRRPLRSRCTRAATSWPSASCCCSTSHGTSSAPSRCGP